MIGVTSKESSPSVRQPDDDEGCSSDSTWGSHVSSSLPDPTSALGCTGSRVGTGGPSRATPTLCHILLRVNNILLGVVNHAGAQVDSNTVSDILLS